LFSSSHKHIYNNSFIIIVTIPIRLT